MFYTPEISPWISSALNRAAVRFQAVPADAWDRMAVAYEPVPWWI